MNRARRVAALIIAAWLAMLLWPLMPDASLGQLKRAVRPLFTPQLRLAEALAWLLGWLIVAEAVFHLVRRQRAIDLLLVLIAVTLVGRAFVRGGTLPVDMIAALLVMLPVRVLGSRLSERTRAGLLAGALLAWLAWPLASGLANRPADFDFTWSGLPAYLASRPAMPTLAGQAFNYLSLGWLLAGAGLLPHVASGVTIVVALLLHIAAMFVPGTAPAWGDLAIAIAAAIIVARWLPRARPGYR